MSDARADRAFRRSIRTATWPREAATRTETDGLGSRQVPADAYWGINVSRALENFPISGRPISVYPDFIFAYACVKQAAARANLDVGELDARRAGLIDRACEGIKDGELHDQFVVDIIQGGAGTSTNMNVNEVVANRGLELGGHAKGDYAQLDPNDHVNRGQSTNDTYPTALKIALSMAVERLLSELELLEAAFRRKSDELVDVVKVGRTQLQDALPMTLGQELEGFAVTLAEDRANLGALIAKLGETNLGATAIGTGVAAHRGFAESARGHLEQITGLHLFTSANLIEASSDVGVFVDVSSALKRSAIRLSKICNDLRLISSGPQAGLGEINLPPRQAGSSIMPGKVNPVIPEVVNEVAFIVAGGDVAVTMAAEAGQLQLNAFLPVIAHALLENLKWLTAAIGTLRVNCVGGVTANEARLTKQVGSFVGVVTALIPHIGYGAAATLAARALATNANIAELVVSSGKLTREQVDELLSVTRLTGR